MHVSRRTATVCVLVVGLFLIIGVYQTPLTSFHMGARPVTLTSRLQHPHELNFELAFQSDARVTYLTDVPERYRKRVLDKAACIRAIKAKRGVRMLKVKMRDNYRFCHKEAPFLGPYDYLPHSKNPCWYSDKGRLMCVPYFYLVGFSKSGTTDLFNRISAHPQITRNRKEKHWFDYGRYFAGRDNIIDYTRKFARTAQDVKRQLETLGTSHAIVGDGTPCYAWDSLYWPCYQGNRGLKEPRYTNPDVIHRLSPKAKIIMVMRDPVTRLYSRYLSWVNKLDIPSYTNPSPYHFHKLCLRAIKLYTQCFRQWSHRHCAYNGTLYSQTELRLQEGMYSVYLRDWLKVFPRDQVLLMKFEDYMTRVPEYLHSIYRFLDVVPMPEQVVQEVAKLRTSNVGKNYDVGPILEETRDALRAFYAPFNKDLQFVLDDPSFAWGYE